MAKYLIEFPEGREYFPEFLPTDNFYSWIYIADDHRRAWGKEFHSLSLKEMSLIEEMAELTQAISKAYRHGSEQSYSECVDPIKEEMAHVLISLKGLAEHLGISPEDIQAEIEKKWPAAYERKIHDRTRT